MTTEELKKRYSQLSDAELTRIALKDSKDLRTEALTLLKAEMTRRKLMDQVSSAIEVQLQALSRTDLLMYCDIIQSQPCPICAKTTQKLNAILVASIVSMIVIKFYEEKLVIACPSCLKGKLQDAKIKNLIFGWWGSGIFTLFKALALNNKMTKKTDQLYPTELLESFVLDNVGKIERYKNNTDELQFLLKRYR